MYSYSNFTLRSVLRFHFIGNHMNTAVLIGWQQATVAGTQDENVRKIARASVDTCSQLPFTLF